MGKCEFLNHSIIAHRGIYNNITIYENSLDSIMYAVKNNLITEFDVRITLDNQLIVFHDECGSRMLKLKDKISSLTKDELDYISHYHISTLKEILDNIKGVVPIVIEIKDDNKIVRNELVNILSEYKGKFVIQSFNYEAIKFYKKKGYVCGLLIDENNNFKLLDKSLDVDFLNIKYNLVDRMKINLLKQKYYVIGWTLDNKKDVLYYINIFNNLIIDNIEEVFK